MKFKDNFDDLIHDDDSEGEELVASFNEKGVKKPIRTEPYIGDVSEFNLIKSGNKSVHLTDLTKVLKTRANHVDLHNKIKKTEKDVKTLEKPLEKPQAERIKRSLGYEKVKKHLGKWDPVVSSNRAANTLSFPLEYDTKLEEKVLARTPYRIKTPLQQKLEALEPKVEVINVDMAFEEKKSDLTMEELLEKRREAAKLRAHQSYKEAKARRQNKIKSKKFHRIQKKEKLKRQMLEFEMLQKTDPEAALRKLDEIEKARAEERLTLRHKSTGQWARSKQVRAKFDKESRQALAEQLAISKELTQKLKTQKDSDSEDEAKELENNKIMQAIPMDESNPWSNIKVSKEIKEFVSGYRKYWETKNNENQSKEPEIKQEIHEDSEEEDEKPIETQFNQILNENEDIKSEDEQEVKSIDKSDQKRKSKSKKPKSLKKKLKLETNDDEDDSTGKLNVSSTSEWDVSTTVDDKEIEDILNSLDNKLEKKMLEKYKRVIADINKQQKTDKKSKTKPKKAKKPKIDLTLFKEAKRPILDEGLLEGEEDNDSEDFQKLNTILSTKGSTEEKETKNKKSDINVDANKIANLKPTELSTELPDLTAYDENEEDTNTQGILYDAFEDDDIKEDFQKDKQADIDKDKPKDIDLFLPGWGSWGGHNINESKKRRRRFIIKMPKKLPRRDDNKGNLTINENGEETAKEHLVNELPFPFKRVKDFEASIRAPIGASFVPQLAFQKLIQPAVTTKLGTIIEPITDEILMKKMKKR